MIPPTLRIADSTGDTIARVVPPPTGAVRSARANRRRAVITVAVLITLCLLQLVVVGVVVGGTRDHLLTARRAEAIRAFYAAEAGMNMAVREIMLDVDEDGDGGIGTISADGSEANNPTLGIASLTTTAVTAGSQRTLTSRGRCGQSTKSMEAVVE